MQELELFVRVRRDDRVRVQLLFLLAPFVLDAVPETREAHQLAVLPLHKVWDLVLRLGSLFQPLVESLRDHQASFLRFHRRPHAPVLQKAVVTAVDGPQHARVVRRSFRPERDQAPFHHFELVFIPIFGGFLGGIVGLVVIIRIVLHWLLLWLFGRCVYFCLRFCILDVVVTRSRRITAIPHTMVWNICSVDKAKGAGRKVVGFTGFIVCWCVVDRQALLLQLVADECRTLLCISFVLSDKIHLDEITHYA